MPSIIAVPARANDDSDTPLDTAIGMVGLIILCAIGGVIVLSILVSIGYGIANRIKKSKEQKKDAQEAPRNNQQPSVAPEDLESARYRLGAYPDRDVGMFELERCVGPASLRTPVYGGPVEPLPAYVHVVGDRRSDGGSRAHRSAMAPAA